MTNKGCYSAVTYFVKICDLPEQISSPEYRKFELLCPTVGLLISDSTSTSDDVLKHSVEHFYSFRVTGTVLIVHFLIQISCINEIGSVKIVYSTDNIINMQHLACYQVKEHIKSMLSFYPHLRCKL